MIFFIRTKTFILDIANDISLRCQKKYVYERLFYKSNMTLFTNALLMFLTGNEEIYWGAKRNHPTDYVFKGYNLHLCYFLGSIAEAQKKYSPRTVAE